MTLFMRKKSTLKNKSFNRRILGLSEVGSSVSKCVKVRSTSAKCSTSGFLLSKEEDFSPLDLSLELQYSLVLTDLLAYVTYNS